MRQKFRNIEVRNRTVSLLFRSCGIDIEFLRDYKITSPWQSNPQKKLATTVEGGSTVCQGTNFPLDFSLHNEQEKKNFSCKTSVSGVAPAPRSPHRSAPLCARRCPFLSFDFCFFFLLFFFITMIAPLEFADFTQLFSSRQKLESDSGSLIQKSTQFDPRPIVTINKLGDSRLVVRGLVK